MRAVLSIGSNMDDRVELLRTVFDEFAGEIVAASPVYATPPWGVTDQDEFLNAVLIVDVDETPKELLRRGQKLDGDDADHDAGGCMKRKVEQARRRASELGKHAAGEVPKAGQQRQQEDGPNFHRPGASRSLVRRTPDQPRWVLPPMAPP